MLGWVPCAAYLGGQKPTRGWRGHMKSHQVWRELQGRPKPLQVNVSWSTFPGRHTPFQERSLVSGCRLFNVGGSPSQPGETLWSVSLRSGLFNWRANKGESFPEDEMVGCHHRLNGHKFQQTPGDGEGQGNLCAAVRGVAKSQTQLRDWTTKKGETNSTVAVPGLCINWGMEKNVLKMGF